MLLRGDILTKSEFLVLPENQNVEGILKVRHAPYPPEFVTLTAFSK